MFTKRDMKPIRAHVSFFLVFSLFSLSSIALQAQQKSLDDVVIQLDGQTIKELNLEECTDLLLTAAVDSLLIACIAKQLIVLKMYEQLVTVNIRWKTTTKTDTLKFVTEFNSYKPTIEQVYLKGIPLKWYANVEETTNSNKSIKDNIRWINERLQLFDFGEIDYAIYRNNESGNFTLKWYLKEKTKSYIDFVAGFGNVNNDNVGVFGQGKMELNHILKPFSKTILQFERLSQRNTILSVQHSQLERISKFGPNQVKLHLSQRDSLFSRNEALISWDIIQSNKLVYSFNLFVQSASVSSRANNFIGTNTGSHQSRGLGLALSYNERNFLRWQPTNTVGFSVNFDQIVKNFQPNNTTSRAFRNSFFTRVNFKTNGTYFIRESSISLHAKIHLYITPTSTNLSAAEVLNTGGLNSIRAYYENQFLAKDAALFTLENRIKLDRDSYFFIFTDAARLNVNQQIIASSGTEWNNAGKWQSILSGGIGIRIFGDQIQTQAIAAFSDRTGFFNPRIHLGIVRLF
jgi:hypothetical protein